MMSVAVKAVPWSERMDLGRPNSSVFWVRRERTAADVGAEVQRHRG